jgi:sugar phosphate permease
VSTTATPNAESRLINRLALRLMPLLGLLYLVAYIDRSNISFAKLQMLGSLGLSEVAYGLGASLFFIGYLIFEVPSNVMLHKYGAPRWMARIMCFLSAVFRRPTRCDSSRSGLARRACIC